MQGYTAALEELDAAEQDDNDLPTGPVAGGVVAGVVVLAALAALCAVLLLRRSRRRRDASDKSGPTQPWLAKEVLAQTALHSMDASKAEPALTSIAWHAHWCTCVQQVCRMAQLSRRKETAVSAMCCRHVALAILAARLLPQAVSSAVEAAVTSARYKRLQAMAHQPV